MKIVFRKHWKAPYRKFRRQVFVGGADGVRWFYARVGRYSFSLVKE